jgi:hypothetical protein
MAVQDAQLSPRDLGARELAGYRVLRSLARDEQAEVLLGHLSPGAPQPSGERAAAGVRSVALKVSEASDGAWKAALRECAALERVRGEHVVELLDVDADEHSISLIFERLPRGDLAELLRLRDRFDAGEAVTLLAPIAITVLRLHAAGVAHGNLSARCVLFRDDGAPTLIGFSRAELFEPGQPEVVLEQLGAVQRDRAAVRALAVTVLGRVTGGRSHSARQLRDDIEACDGELVLPLLASRLFDVAAAVPVRFVADDSESDAAPSGPRAVPLSALVVDPGAPEAGGTRRIAAVLARVVPEPLLQGVLGRIEHSPAVPVVAAAAQAVRQRWASWTPGRRRAALAVGAAGLTAAIVTALVPAGAAAGGPSPSSARPSEPASSRSASVQGDDRPADDPAVAADDPLAAASALTRARQRCLTSLSLLCLDRVDQTGSSALRGDQAAIRAAQQGGELPDPLEGASESAPVLIERLGDSALVQLGRAASTASLLLVKGESGWRIRDVIPANAPAA